MSNISVRLSTKKEQIQQRRAAVLELSSQGLTQQEIAERLGPFDISQRTVSRDLEWLRQDAVQFVKKNRDHIAFEYRQVLSNFYQLRKEAWKQFRQASDNSNIKVSLYDTLQSLNGNIMALLASGDIIDREMIEHAKQQVTEIEEGMEKAIEQQTSRDDNQAKF